MRQPKPFKSLCLITLSLISTSWVAAVQPKIEVDYSAVPEQKAWAEAAGEILTKWYPIYNNMLSTKGFTPTDRVQFALRKSNRGIAGTANGRITVSSGWIEQHPEDLGLVAHELVHIIQAYPNAQPIWVTEGIADYLRWAIFEGKPQNWFPMVDRERGYEASYQVTAGFFLWLETDQAPGIVRRLNKAMRESKYSDEIFKTASGKSLDELWKEYAADRKSNK
ncbi:MAG: basic secretory protein-like protein [Verrucomicrobiota bacterium]|nr:basic secretory protein-like protein [Verrucomicrobiota bacterium]